jgi:glycosyltransferase involved in cell wall biosynthesis
MADRKLRLLLFNLLTDADDSNLGFTTDWINRLAARCESIDVLTMRAGRLAVAENVRVYSVGKERGYGEARRALEFYRHLFRLLRNNHYDICFAHMMPLFAVMGAPLLKLWRVPIVLWYTHKAVSLKLRLAEKVSYRIVTASQESFRLSSPKTRIIGHGVDTDLFVPSPVRRLPNQPFVVVSVGRIAPVKSLQTLIEAANSLYQNLDFHRLRVSIVGEAESRDVNYLAHMHELVSMFRLAEVVDFAGAVSHARVVSEYQEADVMVNTSKTGSIDKAVLEAMACGLPVVTSNEAFKSILAPWSDLLLIPPESPGKLVVSLLRLKDMTWEERAALGLQLREIVLRDHSLQGLVDKLMNVFQTGEPEQ